MQRRWRGSGCCMPANSMRALRASRASPHRRSARCRLRGPSGSADRLRLRGLEPSRGIPGLPDHRREACLPASTRSAVRFQMTLDRSCMRSGKRSMSHSGSMREVMRMIGRGFSSRYSMSIATMELVGWSLACELRRRAGRQEHLIAGSEACDTIWIAGEHGVAESRIVVVK